jgi:hypothetical protein
MTATGRWLEIRRAQLAWARHRATLGLAGGAALTLAALGVVAARLGVYQRAPDSVALIWLAIAGVGVGALMAWRRGTRHVVPAALARTIEQQGALRSGAIAGAADEQALHGSAALVALADRRAAAWLEQHGEPALAPARAVQARATRRAAVGLGAGVLSLVIAGPTSPRGATFFQPVSVILRARAPVGLAVDRHGVRRGGTVRVTVQAPGRAAATLFARAPGEAWTATPLTLDDSGHAGATLGPLESDRYLYAESGGRWSDTVRVQVELPAFLNDLALVAQYPAYIGRGDEPLAVGPDTILLPVGTHIRTTGRATVDLAKAAWQSASDNVPLKVSGVIFTGDLAVRANGSWHLAVTPRNGRELEDQAPELHIAALPDSAPVVSIPVPGRDTVAPVTLLQPLVIDARDDYQVTRVEIVSRRASRVTGSGPALTQALPLPDGGVPRAVLQWVLDLNGRGFLPGDTAFFLVRATDNAPAPHHSETREYALRLPSLSELRESVRQRTSAMAGSVDSLARAQRDLSQHTQDLAAERERTQEATSGRPPETGAPQELPFRSAQRAQDLADQQRRVLDRAAEIREKLSELSRAVERSGMADTAWRNQLRDIQDLLQRAVTPELAAKLEQLRQALQRLDAQGTQDALRQLAAAQQQLKEALERSRDLFERAAIEGMMSSLAQDAAELSQRQDEWNRAAARGADSSLARPERELTQAADALAKRLDTLARQMRESNTSPAAVQRGSQAAQQASAEMQRAAQAAEQGQQRAAQQAGEQASQSLSPLAQGLKQARDSLQMAWREEVVAGLDRALAETAALAKRQQQVADRLRNGESGASVRGDQAALRDGVDRIMQRLQSAAGKNALVPAQLGQSLGYTKLQMSGALSELEQGASGNGRRAGEAAGEAVDGLNAVAYALLRSRQDVSGSQSGSGFAEAVERMAQLAQQQQGLNGQAGGLLPLMQGGGDAVLQQLRALAQRQRALADELDRLRQGSGAAGPLAEEARELARRLEAGQLDQPTVERQERLFRRLLDAGRTLRGDEPDEQQERQSVTAGADSVHVPPALQKGGEAPRYPYPSWDVLRQLSPEDRRLILDYFRRLNETHR